MGALQKIEALGEQPTASWKLTDEDCNFDGAYDDPFHITLPESSVETLEILINPLEPLGQHIKVRVQPHTPYKARRAFIVVHGEPIDYILLRAQSRLTGTWIWGGRPTITFRELGAITNVDGQEL